jgi:hypothetical protein
MNDEELITAVLDSVADVHTATPVEQIVSRGRAVRARRRVPRLTVALAAVAGAAIGVTALLPASHPASPQPDARLTAWTVVRQPGGDVSVTIRQLYNPAGLQRELRAVGVPAVVTFYATQPYPPSCRPYPASRAVLQKAFPSDRDNPLAAVVIRPSALPAGAAVYINDSSNSYGYIGLHTGLVRASKQCTTS